MSEEWFDIVDEQDVPVSKATRAETHRRGLRHRAIHVLVFDREGRVFLQKRSMAKDTAPGLWDSSSSGHVDAGESYDACAVRELREEIGLCLAAPPTPLFKLPAGPETGQEFVWVYRTEAEGPFTLNPQEIERGDWVSPAEVDRWMAGRPDDFARAFRTLWTRLRTPAT